MKTLIIFFSLYTFPFFIFGNSLSEIRLGYFANLTHAQALLGIESGDFEKAFDEKIKLKTKIFNAGPSLIEAIYAGEIDIGYIGPGPALNGYQKSHGQEIRVIAGAASNGVVIVARPNANIQSFDDLKGKKIATPQHGNTQDISARHFIQEKFGITELKNILPIPNAEQAGLMQRGNIDASWTPEPWGSLLIKQVGTKLIIEEKDLWPEKKFGLTYMIASAEFVKNHSNELKKFLTVHQALTKNLKNNSEQFNIPIQRAIKKLTGKEIPLDVIEMAMKRIEFESGTHQETFRTYLTWMVDLGFSRARIPLQGMFAEKVGE